MNEELRRAIQENQRWLAQFNRREYAGAFQTYVKQYGPRYMAAVQSAGEGALPAMAAALLDHLETGWHAARGDGPLPAEPTNRCWHFIYLPCCWDWKNRDASALRSC